MENSKHEYNASEHDDLFSVPSAENVAEQWLVSMLFRRIRVFLTV